MAIIMGKGCIEAIYGLMGWKGLMYHIVVRNQGRHKAITSKGKVYYASLQKDIKLKFCLNSVAMGTFLFNTLSKFCS